MEEKQVFVGYMLRINIQSTGNKVPLLTHPVSVLGASYPLFKYINKFDYNKVGSVERRDYKW